MPIILTTEEVKYLKELVAAGERAAPLLRQVTEIKTPRGSRLCRKSADEHAHYALSDHR